MREPWIHSAKADAIFILLPPYLVLAIIFIFQVQIASLQTDYSFFTWFFLIVFVDVGHVYSTLFKTYFVKQEFSRRKQLYLMVPILSLIFGLALFQFGSLAFWGVLALVAVFHFIRQQYGFMRLYARFEPNNIHKKIDNIAIYSATIFPMLYWFATPRKFTWFVNHEFDWMGYLPNYVPIITVAYFVILAIWIIKTLSVYFKFREFNIPKNSLIIGTYLSWYFGIVYFNDDFIFTFLNVVSHGVPYIALIYFNEIEKRDEVYLQKLRVYKNTIGAFIFITTLLVIAFSEEFLWEVLVWRENISFQEVNLPNDWQMLLVPLLTVPQLTHYILDGFIWKRPK